MSIVLIDVVFSVAGEGAGSGIAPAIGEGRPFAVGGGQDDRAVEVDQVCVLADAVGVVARGTGAILALDVLLVLIEALVVEDAGTVVAFIAKGVGLRALGGVVSRAVVVRQQRRVSGPVRAGGIGGVVAAVAIGAVNHRGGVVVLEQARDVGVPALRLNGVVTGVGGVEGVGDVAVVEEAVNASYHLVSSTTDRAGVSGTWVV